MAEYLPYSNSHSIQEMHVALHLHHEFDQVDIESIRSDVEPSLREQLPRSTEIHGGSVTLDLTNPGIQPQVGASLQGFQFSNVRGDGKPAQTLDFTRNLISVRVQEYSNWDSVCAACMEYITAVVVPLQQLSRNPVMACSLRFIDRYTFNGATDQANADQLFIRNKHIAEQCFEAGSLWHCHTGWFDAIEAGRVLNHLNITSSVIDQSATVIIDHQATVHLNTPRHSSEAIFAPPQQGFGLSSMLNNLHEKNKEVLKSMLRSDLLSKIGLDE